MRYSHKAMQNFFSFNSHLLRTIRKREITLDWYENERFETQNSVTAINGLLKVPIMAYNIKSRFDTTSFHSTLRNL